MLHGQARLIVQDNKAAKQEIELAIGKIGRASCRERV